jgi:carbon monoxide dehydrogenase subunit G
MVSQVQATVPMIWDILTDPAYLPKLYPNVITIETDRPGRNLVGTKTHLVLMAGRRRMEVFAETVELVTERKMRIRNRPGGLFASFESVIFLEPKGDSTELRMSFDYELSMGYLGKLFNLIMMERLVTDNLKSYMRNLKEISELIPVPA